MSDTRNYCQLRSQRARDLRVRIDDAINALLVVNRAIDEVSHADMDMPGELDAVELGDLQRCVETALFSMRAAERIANAHIADMDQEISRLDIDP